MSRLWCNICLLLALAVTLGACAVVDQFDSRVYSSNLNSQNAMNQEMLLNIIRASQYQPLNFVAVAQVTGNQMETLNNGLPTFTFGPAQTAAQRQFAFGSNALSSSVQGAFQSNPLVSSAFSQGMLSPMDTRTLALLVNYRLREPVFYAVVDSITLKINGVPVDYRNDPSDNTDKKRKISGEACTNLALNSNSAAFYLNGESCSFGKFQNFLDDFLDVGLTAELIPCNPSAATPLPGCPAKAASPSPGGASQGSTTTQSIGRLCFNPTLAGPGRKSYALNLKPQCGSKPAATLSPLKVQMPYLGTVELGLNLRSPMGVFNYFGQLLRDNDADQVGFYTGEAKKLGSLLDIQVGPTSDKCFVSALYQGDFYCVPEGAMATAMMLDLLEQLRNLSITPTDLNAAFAVHVVD